MNKVFSLLIRLFLFPFGVIFKLYFIGTNGARDLSNKLKYKNSIIDQDCRISKDSQIGYKCRLLAGNLLVKSSINRYSYLGQNCIVHDAEIGSFCSIANEVLIGLGSHPISLFSTSPIFYKEQNCMDIKPVNTNTKFEEYKHIIIGNDVWIGTRAIIMDGIRIGDGAIVASNAVVTNDVPPYSIVAGIPAKVLKYRFDDEKIRQLLEIKWWTWDIDKIESNINHLTNL